MSSLLPETFVPSFHNEAAVRAMRYNELGQTGIRLSHLGLGGSAFSNIYGGYTEEECIAAIQEAIREGINFIDTGPWYGQGLSEEILGKALKRIPRRAYYIATKVGRYELDPRHMFDFSAEKTRESIQKSLRRLKLNHVDIIQVHDVEFAPSLDIVLKETLPVVQEAVTHKRAKFIGITGYPLSVLKEVVLRSHDVRIDSVLSYTRDTLVDNSLQEYLPFFKLHGVGVICASGTGMGLLTNDGPPSWHPAPQEIKDTCRRAAEYCKGKGVELARLAVHHALTRQGQATHIVGLNCREILHSNLQILRQGLNIKEQEVYDYIQDRFFCDMAVRHWEGKELQERAEKLKELEEKYPKEGGV